MARTRETGGHPRDPAFVRQLLTRSKVQDLRKSFATRFLPFWQAMTSGVFPYSSRTSTPCAEGGDFPLLCRPKVSAPWIQKSSRMQTQSRVAWILAGCVMDVRLAHDGRKRRKDGWRDKRSTPVLHRVYTAGVSESLTRKIVAWLIESVRVRSFACLRGLAPRRI